MQPGCVHQRARLCRDDHVQIHVPVRMLATTSHATYVQRVNRASGHVTSLVSPCAGPGCYYCGHASLIAHSHEEAAHARGVFTFPPLHLREFTAGTHVHKSTRQTRNPQVVARTSALDDCADSPGSDTRGCKGRFHYSCLPPAAPAGVAQALPECSSPWGARQRGPQFSPGRPQFSRG